MLAGHDVDEITIEGQDTLLSLPERGQLLPGDGVLFVIARAGHEVLLLRQGMEHLQPFLTLLRSFNVDQERRIRRRAARRAGQS